MLTVFALAAALLYGSADFLGGAATRRAHVLSVLPVGGDAASLREATAGRRTPVTSRGTARGIGYGVASGVAFGIFFLFIRNGGESGAFWPVAVARVAGTLIVLAAATGTRVAPLRWQADRRLFLAALGAAGGPGPGRGGHPAGHGVTQIRAGSCGRTSRIWSSGRRNPGEGDRPEGLVVGRVRLARARLVVATPEEHPTYF
jgi:hypothetical protein